MDDFSAWCLSIKAQSRYLEFPRCWIIYLLSYRRMLLPFYANWNFELFLSGLGVTTNIDSKWVMIVNGWNCQRMKKSNIRYRQFYYNNYQIHEDIFCWLRCEDVKRVIDAYHCGKNNELKVYCTNFCRCGKLVWLGMRKLVNCLVL